MIKISNKSKGLKWIYGPSCYGIPDDGNDVTWLSHWKFGNRLECGDEVTVSVFTHPPFLVKECGIQLVHEREVEIMSTQDYNIDPGHPFYEDLEEFVPGTYFLWGGPMVKDKDYVFSWQKEDWFRGIFGDSNEENGMLFSKVVRTLTLSSGIVLVSALKYDIYQS